MLILQKYVLRTMYRITISFLKQFSQPEKIANKSCRQIPAQICPSVPPPRISVPALRGVHPLYYEKNIPAVAPELYPLHSYFQHLSANCASPCFAHAWKHRVTSLQASPPVSETTAQCKASLAVLSLALGGPQGEHALLPRLQNHTEICFPPP